MSRRRDPSYNILLGLMNIATGTSRHMSIKRLLELRDMLTLHANGRRIINIREFVYVRNNELNRLINVSHLRPMAQNIVMLRGSDSTSKKQMLEIQRRFIQLIESAIESDLLEPVNSNSNSNSNNRRTTESKKSASTKLSKAKTNKIKKSTPGTPQSKRRKKPNK